MSKNREPPEYQWLQEQFNKRTLDSETVINAVAYVDALYKQYGEKIPATFHLTVPNCVRVTFDTITPTLAEGSKIHMGSVVFQINPYVLIRSNELQLQIRYEMAGSSSAARLNNDEALIKANGGLFPTHSDCRFVTSLYDFEKFYTRLAEQDWRSFKIQEGPKGLQIFMDNLFKDCLQ